MQLWVAQPEATRHGEPAFEHHAELPAVEPVDGAAATVLVGALAGATSPARRDTDHVGVDLAAAGRRHAVLPLDPAFEHALVVLDGALRGRRRPRRARRSSPTSGSGATSSP